MIKNYLLLLVLSVVLCFVNGWRVFPLPDAPAPVQPVTALVKPTPVLNRFPVASSTSAVSNLQPFKILPSKLEPILSTREYGDVPSPDLLPPKIEFTKYDP